MTDREKITARLVVVGAGFAGASLIRNLPSPLRNPASTLLIDASPELGFAPLSHEVAVGRLRPDSLKSPVSKLASGRCRFLRDRVTEVSPESHTLKTSTADVSYEYLVMATGSAAAEPPEDLAPYMSTFWNIEDALALRDRLSDGWADATGPVDSSEPLNVAVVGGGSTGVELTAEIAVLFQYLDGRAGFARRPVEPPRVTLFEAEDRLMTWLDDYFHDRAMEALEKLGVEVRLGARIEGADESGVVADGESFPANVRVWTAGLEIPSPTRFLPGDHDPSGRVSITSHLTLPDHPDVYVPGDAGVYEDPDFGPLPTTASVAVQQGPYIARDLSRRLDGRRRPAFDYFDRGYVVSLGPENAVADALGRKFSGPPAQALYRSILLYYLKDRGNRACTTSDWAIERLGRVGFR